MNFAISFKSEFLKTKRTSSWYIGLAAAGFVPFVLFSDYLFQEDVKAKILSDPWKTYLSESFIWFNIVSLPLFVLLTSTLLPQVEYRNNTWKQVLASPQPLLQIYLSRYAVLLSMITWFFLSHIIIVIVTGIAVGTLLPQYLLFDFPFDFQLMIKLAAKSAICVLAISAFEFWMGLRFRNFIAPIVIGFVLWIFSNVTTFEFKLPLFELNPFTYLTVASVTRFQNNFGWVIVGSIFYCVVFLGLGFLDFKRKRLR